MGRAKVFGLIPGFRFEDYENEITLSYGITICLSPNDITSKLLESCRDSISTDELEKISNCQYTVKIETDDSNEAAEKAIDNIHEFIGILRVVKPILAYPKYVFSYNYDGKYYFLRRKVCYDPCHAIDASVEMHKFPVDLTSEVIPIWNNVPQILQNNSRVKWAHWLSEKAYFEKYHEFRILNFAMALESLFSKKETQLTHKLATRASQFLTSDITMRDKIYRRVRFAYDVRSKIVHGLREEIQLRALRYTEIICREGIRTCLLKIMKDNNLICTFDGPSHDYDKYFASLL